MPPSALRGQAEKDLGQAEKNLGQAEKNLDGLATRRPWGQNRNSASISSVVPAGMLLLECFPPGSRTLRARHARPGIQQSPPTEKREA